VIRPEDTLVSIGLPVRNGAEKLEHLIQSLLAQSHSRLELVISDNASTDATEEICRAFAKTDERVVYVRHPQNVGLLNNFKSTIERARGEFFRWISHDDLLEPTAISRCLDVMLSDDRLILVTAGYAYTTAGGIQTTVYESQRLRSADCVERFAEMLRLLTTPGELVDPLYSLLRRRSVAVIPRRNMLREDEIFAAKMALAGPWGHVPEVLAHRQWTSDSMVTTARRLGVPVWQARAATALQCRELLSWLNAFDFTPEQRRRARSAVYQLFLRRQLHKVQRRGASIGRIIGGRWSHIAPSN
jgi:hypothetical protein